MTTITDCVVAFN